jgi:nucleotide-binding universal stress UspA family protein
MSYRTILLSLNEVGRLDALIETTVQLATDNNSYVKGLYVIPAPMVTAFEGANFLPDIFDTCTAFFEERAHSVRKKFEDAMMQNEISFEWRILKPNVPIVAESTCSEGRSADLVIISKIDRSSTFGVELDFVESVVLGSGRPVFVLPREATYGLTTNEIVCGYNGSKEAARAIHDALPILKTAENVRLVWVNPSLDDERGDLAVADMAACLSRHGVRVIVDPMPTNIANPFDALSLRAKDVGARVIVMGAYGHNRLREFVLGGATRRALATMSLPVLMSH